MNESFVTWRRNARWEDAERLYGAFGAEDGRMRSVCAEETELRMGGSLSCVRRKRSGGWEVSERLYGAVGENSIDFLEKLYRLSSDTL